MPKGPKGEKRPADVIGNAVHIMRIATGQTLEEKPLSAAERGRKGAEARAKSVPKKKRREIAQKAAAARWQKEPT